LFRRAVVAVALLATCENALAGNLLRSGYGNATRAEGSRAAAQAAAAAQQAAAEARRTKSALRLGRESLRAFQAGQEAARAAAQAQSRGVPNGLEGLQIADGVGQDASLWQGAERPTEASRDGRTEVTVRQNDEKAILTWKTFDVGRETDLHFDQTAGGSNVREWVALNRVTGTEKPSQILGTIKAEGQVYIINRNGIIFGGASQVNVGTLIATPTRSSPTSRRSPGGTRPSREVLSRARPWRRSSSRSKRGRLRARSTRSG
jgi:filamentous hemagglutinin family protein